MQDLETRGLELAFGRCGDSGDVRIRSVEAEQMDVKRRDRPGPDDAVRIVTLFDDGRDGPRNPDAVAPHHHRFARTTFVEIVALHGGRVLRPQLEHLPNFNSAEALVGAFCTARATVT